MDVIRRDDTLVFNPWNTEIACHMLEKIGEMGQLRMKDPFDERTEKITAARTIYAGGMRYHNFTKNIIRRTCTALWIISFWLRSGEGPQKNPVERFNAMIQPMLCARYGVGPSLLLYVHLL